MKIGWILFVLGIFCLKNIKLESTDWEPTIDGSESEAANKESLTVDAESSEPILILAPNGASFHYVENNELELILSSDELKDHYIVVISTVGQIQTGKSFLMNIFLKYLRSNGKFKLVKPISSTNSSDSSDWLSTDINNGFESKSNETGDTKGIWSWPEIFTYVNKDGMKVAILLLDTEGMHEMHNDLAHDATIFTLSTLTSSMQFYNYKTDIDKRVFEQIKKYGDFALSENGAGVGKPFQWLEFVIRDYLYAETDEKITMDVSNLTIVNEIQRYYSEPFQAFTLPQPAIQFDGVISHALQEFKEKIKEIVPKLLSPDKLLVKNIFGQKIKAKDIMTYFKEYAAIFTNGTPPQPSEIFNITAKVTNSQICAASLEHYESLMKEKLNGTNSYYKTDALQALHNQSMNESIGKFNKARTVGGESYTAPFREMLSKDIEREFIKFNDTNEQKRKDYFNRTDLYYKNLSNTIRDEFEKEFFEKVNQTDPSQINSSLVVSIFKPLMTNAFEKFNASEYNNDTDVSTATRNHLNDCFSHYEFDLNKLLDLYNRSAEAYVSSINGLFKDRKYYNQTELEQKHQDAKRNALKVFDDARGNDQLGLRNKLEKFIENKFKKINEENQVNQIKDEFVLMPFNENLLQQQTTNEQMQLYKTKVSMEHESLKIKATEISIQMAEIERKKAEEMAKIDVEKYKALSQIEIEKKRAIAQLEIDAERKRLGL